MTNVIDKIADTEIEALTKNGNDTQRIIKAGADAMAKSRRDVRHIVQNNARTMAKGGNAAMTGFQELAKAYQAIATRNAETLTASMQAFAAVKSPAEFVELQRKLITEGMSAAVHDFQAIGKLTTAAFTTALEPMQKQIEALQNNMKK